MKFRQNFALIRIDAQKLFRENYEENLSFCAFRYFCYFVISSYFVISLNFEKQFQEMMNKFKIKPIRVNYTPACSALTHAGRMSPNSQVLGHQPVPTITLFTGNQSHVVTVLLTN